MNIFCRKLPVIHNNNIYQESVLDLERGKRDLEQSILRKDTEIHQMMTQLDDEQSGMNRIQKSIKELQVSLFKTMSYDT